MAEGREIGKAPRNRKMVLRIITWTAFAVTFVVATLTMQAQRITGTLRGQVLDPQAAAISGAEVTATNDSTGVANKTATTSAGTFVFPSLPPGAYTIKASAKGFSTETHKGVTVNANQINDTNIQLAVGQESQVVEVTAGGETVQTTSSTLSTNFHSQEVVNLPNTAALNGSPLNLAVYAPNTVAQPGGVAGTGGAIGGARPRDNNFMVDGVDDNNLGNTGNNSTVIPDAVSELNLATNQISAEYGHSAGGQFNVVTKSGTNDWHGSGEWYMQNRNLNALDNLTKQAISSGTFDHVPRFDNNRFGGTIGGPLVKNKWFIFGAYEYTTIHGEGNAQSLTVPTAAGLTQLEGAANDSVRSRLGFFPVAPANDQGTVDVNGTGIPIGTLVLVSPLLQREHDAIINSDYTTNAHHFGVRYLYNHGKFIVPVSVPQEGFNQDQALVNHKVALTDTWTINDRLVNDARLSYSKYFLDNENRPGFDNVPDVSILELSLFQQGTADRQYQKQNTYQVLDNLSWIHGRHTFKFGGEYRHNIYPQFFLPRSVGDYWYSSTQDFVNDLVPTINSRTLRNAGTGEFLGTQSGIFGYAQDDFKVMPRLTINLGLRYEYWTNPVGGETQVLNAVSNVPGAITLGKPKTDKNNFMPRVGFAWDLFGNGKTALRGGFGVAYDVKFQNFASITLPPQLQTELTLASSCTLTPQPAWCSTGNNFLATGGMPTTFVPPTTAEEARALTSSYIDDTVMPKILSWSLGIQHELYKNATLEVRYLGTRGLSLPVQYRLNFRSAFDAGWAPLPVYFNASEVPGVIATAPAHTAEDLNNFAANAGPYELTGANKFAQYGFLSNVTSDPPFGSSVYHGGSVDFTQRLQHGLFVNANYTYSHTIDDSTNEFFTSLLNPRRAQDTNHLGQDRSNSDLDVRHKFALSLLDHLPNFTPKSNSWLSALVNGFELGSTVLLQTGQPVTAQSGIDANANGDSAGDRAVLNPSGIGLTGTDAFTVCRNDASGATTLSSTTVTVDGSCASGFSGVGYLAANPSARFVAAGPGAMTTSGRNSVLSPGFGLLNLSVYKEVHLSESKYLQLRSEFYNVLNHRNYTIGNGNISSVNSIPVAQGSGQYVQVADPSFLNSKVFSGGNRQVVLGLKLVF